MKLAAKRPPSPDRTGTDGAAKATPRPRVRKAAGAADDGPPDRLPFPIVGIGASAGGLEAFTKLLQYLPADTGMAIVLVQHLDPKHKSLLVPLLSRATRMPVVEARSGMRVGPNHVHVIPPNVQMSISGGVLALEPRLDLRGAPKPIDHFFQSLAADQGRRAIGIVLSGAADDGALGLTTIKALGGVTMAQDQQSASYPEMPRNAAATGLVDLILPPSALGIELARRSRRKLPLIETAPLDEDSLPEERLSRIFLLLRIATGVDFRHYKSNTVNRRIRRRMVVNHCDTLEAYITLLEARPAELPALYNDILINVTEFFRDPDMFRALKRDVLPKLLKTKPRGVPIRIWVPGCSSGEEAYSIAMCLAECIRGTPAEPMMQIFGTDIDDGAIAQARAGIYPEKQVLRLPKERIRRFFTRVDGGYQIESKIREACLFAHHNLLADPPFSRLDLISCRNVLIYWQPALHRKMIPVLHYALRPGGLLVLGSSESIQGFSASFDLIHKKYRFYSRRDSPASGSLIPPGMTAPLVLPLMTPSKADVPEWTEAAIRNAVDRIIVARHGPPGVVVNSRMEVVQSHGALSSFLRMAPGAASHSILKMAADGLRAELGMVLTKVIAEKKPRTGFGHIERNGEACEVTMAAYPLVAGEGKETNVLVLFSLPASAKPDPVTEVSAIDLDLPDDPALAHRKLAVTREYLMTLLQERDAAMRDLAALHEEVQSGNEELQSANEELQSTNEELQTAKEELQATNEELNTLNDELQSRNADLIRLNDDLTNLISSATMPIVILDNDLTLRRITPAAEGLMNLRPTDIGRPLTDIRLKLSVEDIEPTLRAVLETLDTREIEIQDRTGRWHCLRVRPYRTSDGRVEGVVLVLIDITDQRAARNLLTKERTRLVDTLASESSQLVRVGKSLEAEKVGRRITEGALHHTEGALLRSRRELRALTGRLFTMQDEERRRISREIHDDLSQKIAHIEFDVAVLSQRLPPEPSQTRKRLEAVRKQVEAFSGDLRRIAYQLHPSKLEHLGLAVAVRSLAGEFNRRNGIPVTCRFRGVPAMLDPAIGASLYRIVQEALHNAAKHAGKKATVDLSITAASHHLHVTIRDDGVGFDSATLHQSEGLGLISMQERVRLLSGTLDFESQPGRGVRIRIRVPIIERKQT